MKMFRMKKKKNKLTILCKTGNHHGSNMEAKRIINYKNANNFDNMNNRNNRKQ